jgi:hypothetical protein
VFEAEGDVAAGGPLVQVTAVIEVVVAAVDRLARIASP